MKRACDDCFIGDRTRNNSVCPDCESRMAACSGEYISPPPKQDVIFYTQNQHHIAAEDRMAGVLKKLGYKTETEMWLDLQQFTLKVVALKTGYASEIVRMKMKAKGFTRKRRLKNKRLLSRVGNYRV